MRRFSRQGGRLVGLVSLTALLSTAAGSYGTAAAAAPYPPTSTCALSWSPDTAAGADRALLVGSGYDSNRPVAVTAYPQARTVGSIVTNSAGAFEVPVDVSGGDSSTWYTANTVHRTCSVVPPTSSTPVGSTPSDSAPVGGSGGTSAAGGGTAGGGTNAGGAGAGAGAGATGGSTAAAGAGAGNGSTGGTGGGTGSTGSPYPPRASGSTAGSGPASSTPGSTTPTQPSGPTSAPPNADSRVPSTLGLPLSVIVTIAALLLLAGGLAVLFLTRRAG